MIVDQHGNEIKISPRRDNPFPISRRLARQLRRSFFQAADNDRLLSGWTVTPTAFDAWLRNELSILRARSREQATNNDYARRFITLAKTNVIGSTGIMAQSRVTSPPRNGKPPEPDRLANDAIEAAFREWGDRKLCDVRGSLTFRDMQNLFIGTAARDGEFLAIRHIGSRVNRYGYALEIIDPERLDTRKNERLADGRIIRLGVEYDRRGRRLAYWINQVDELGRYVRGNPDRIPADQVIHAFLHEDAEQSRGVPWMATALYRMKMLHGYEDAAMIASRIGASKMGFYSTEDGNSGELGDEDEDESGGALIQEVEPGVLEQLPAGTTFSSFDPTYPHQMFPDFVKACLRGISAGLGASYHALAQDLESVNYSSLRAGRLDELEIWKALQDWAIGEFVRPVREDFITYAVMNRSIVVLGKPLARSEDDYKPAHYQGRRWDWVDPLKEETANQKAVDMRSRSVSSIIRQRGEDPDDVFREIAEERRKLRELGILPIEPKAPPAPAEPEPEPEPVEGGDDE